MRSLIFVLLLSAVGFTSCDELPEQPSADNACPAIACTEDFRSVMVKIETSSGDTVSIKELTVKNLSTGKFIDNSNFKDVLSGIGIFLVVTDAETKNFSEKGDTVLVTAKALSNQVKQAEFVIAGGKCACHIAKVSGPEKIVF